jgi:radical SAM superfamily enzyme YgiQ (UPF0313 family)
MIEDVVAADAAIVGFTTYDVQLPSLFALITDLRRAGLHSHVTLGGLCASSVPERILRHAPGVDSVVFGEGEGPVVDLAHHVIRRRSEHPPPGICFRRNRSIVRGEPAAPSDLNVLPSPALDDFCDRDRSAPVSLVNECVPVYASRGCYGRCAFCCIQKFYRASSGPVWRGRDAARVADEVATVQRVTGCQRVTFVDENFMGPGGAGRRHAEEIAGEITRHRLDVSFNFGCRSSDIDRETLIRLKSAGLRAVSLGIESMSDSALVLFNKHTNWHINSDALRLLEELAIFVEITFIFFHPLSSLEEIRDNLDFVDWVRRSRYAYFNNSQPFSEFIPFFGTDLTRTLEEQGLVERTMDGYTLRYADPRVSLIARSILSVPVDRLSRMRRILPARNGGALGEIRDAFERSEVHLKMVRLPELARDLCDALTKDARPTSPRVRAVLAELNFEAKKIRKLEDRLLACVA